MNEEAPVYSFWPIFLAVGILLIAVGFVWTTPISILGLLILFGSIIGWVWENRVDYPYEGDEND